MALKTHLRGLVRRFGFDVIRFDGRRIPELRRAELMKTLNVDLVIDVGANTGQYIAEIRAYGFQGPIVAFEPLPEAFEVLADAAQRDARLTVHQVAIGADEREAIMHVSGTSYSSSLLPMEEAHLRAAANSHYVRDESVGVRSLDSFDLLADGFTGWIKIDVQGFEREVLLGATRTLERAGAVEIELSYVPLYTGQAPRLRDPGDTRSSRLQARGLRQIAVRPHRDDPPAG